MWSYSSSVQGGRSCEGAEAKARRTRMEIFSPNICYFVAIIIFIAIYAFFGTQVAGAWTERKKMFHGESFLKLADDDV